METLTDPDQTLTDPDQTLNDPDQTLNDQDQTPRDPDQTLNDPDQTLRDPDQTLNDPDQTLTDPDQTLTDPDQTVDTSDQELPHSASRDYLDSLLDISEESFWMHQVSCEDQWCSGWDEAVRGWGRAAPMAGVYLPQKKENEVKKQKNAKHTKTQSQQPATVGGILKSESSGGLAELHCELSFIKTTQSPESILTSTEKTTSHVLLREKITEEVKPNRSSPWLHLNRTTRHPHYRPTTVVPIKNITFSPPPESARHKLQGVSAQKVPEGEALELDSFTADKKRGGVRRAKERRAEIPSATPTSKYQNDQRSECCWEKTMRTCSPTAEALKQLRWPQLHHLSSKYTLVSIKKSTSLPPLKSSQLNQQQIYRGKPVSNTESLHFEKRSGGWRDTKLSSLTSNHHQLVSPYEASLSSKPNSVFCTEYFTQAVPSGRASGAQTQT